MVSSCPHLLWHRVVAPQRAPTVGFLQRRRPVHADIDHALAPWRERTTLRPWDVVGYRSPDCRQWPTARRVQARYRSEQPVRIGMAGLGEELVPLRPFDYPARVQHVDDVAQAGDHAK